MLLGADLGLLLSSLVTVVVGWFLVRRKWRRVVARGQEIERLLALASEETARAELDAAATFCYDEEPTAVASASPPQRQFQYQCEVCFSPTTTRCKRCKAVWYCSGKCQIIHWRQGHKDECSSFASHQNKDVVLLRQDVFKSSDNLNGIALGHPPSYGDHDFSDSSLHHVIEKNDKKIGSNHDGKETNNTSKDSVSLSNERASTSSLNDANQFREPDIFGNMGAVEPILSKQSSSARRIQGAAASGMICQFKSGCFDTGELSESSTSSGSNASGSEELSLFEPSTPSSDFWEATVEPIGTKINAQNELREIKSQNSPSSSLSSSERSDVCLEVPGLRMNNDIEDNLGSTLMATNPTDESALPKKGNTNCLKSRVPILMTYQVPVHCNVKNFSPECISKTEEAKSSSSAIFLEHKGSESKVKELNKVAPEVCSMQNLSPKILGSKNRTFAVSGPVECQQNDSLILEDSKNIISSSGCIRNHAIQDVQSREHGADHGVGACSMNCCDVHNAKSGVISPATGEVDQLQASKSIRQSYFGSKNGSTGKYEGSLSYEHFVQLYNWNKVELRPCGLINCGNSCYANAVLQCLAFTPPLTAYFLQGLHSKTCKKREWCFTCEFEFLVKKAKEGNFPVSPAPVLSQMERLGSHLGNGREEDAHEFLRYVIDAMQYVHLNKAGFNKPSSLDEETTLVGLTFGGYLRSKIECMRCGGKSEQHERIMDLSVEIGGDIGTLEEALNQFTRSETLDGENKYHCGRCKSYEKAKKKLRVLEAPNVLTIALKRFQSGQYGKLNKVVKFPEVLNLAPYMSGTSDKSPIYRLYGVVVHLDAMKSTFSGHYVCYLKNNAGRWFKADDTSVQVVELERVLLTAAYMLFYARCSPRSPKLRRSTMVPQPRKVKNQTCKCKTHRVEPRDASIGELNGQTCNDCFYQHCLRYHYTRANSEEDSSSDKSSSIFSDAGSSSSESSNRESTSTNESFDQILGDLGSHLNKSWRSSSDSDTSSSSASSSPSPHYTRHSMLSNLDRYSLGTETSGSNLFKAGFKVAGSTENGRGVFSCPDTHTRLVSSCSSSCCSRENEPSRVVGRNNTRDNPKSVHLRRSVWGKVDGTMLR